MNIQHAKQHAVPAAMTKEDAKAFFLIYASARRLECSGGPGCQVPKASSRSPAA